MTQEPVPFSDISGDVPEGKVRFEVDLPIVSEIFFAVNSMCPHCESYSHPELIETFETSKLMADLMTCTGGCDQLFLVVEFPVFFSEKPVFTRWSFLHDEDELQE